MFGRVIVGVIIGIVAGIALSVTANGESRGAKIALAFIALVIIAFISSSFMFGAIYGVMAIGEIFLGYFLTNKFLAKQKA